MCTWNYTMHLNKEKQIMMKDFLKLIILFTILITSCQKELKLEELGNYQDKIVLNGIIYADSAGRINVGRTIGILENNNQSVVLENANVTMVNGQNQTYTFQHDFDGYYFLDETIFNTGETYEFTVNNDGFSTVSSTVIIPPKTTIVSIDTSFAEGTHPNCIGCALDRNLKLTLNVKSTTKEKEYFIVSFSSPPDTFSYEIEYRVEYKIDTTFEYFDTIYYDSPQIVQHNLELFSYDRNLKIVNQGSYLEEVYNDGYYYYGNELYFEKPEGETEHNVTLYIYGFHPSKDEIYTISFTVISEDFYKHQLSLARAYYAEYDFLAEKVSIYTNIKDGMGILAGANQTSKIINFSEHSE